VWRPSALAGPRTAGRTAESDDAILYRQALGQAAGSAIEIALQNVNAMRKRVQIVLVVTEFTCVAQHLTELRIFSAEYFQRGSVREVCVSLFRGSNSVPDFLEGLAEIIMGFHGFERNSFPEDS